MEGPAGMTGEPLPHLRMLMSGVIVDDRVDCLSLRHLGLDGIEEADELLMPMVRHAAAGDFTFQDVEGGEQRSGAVALIVGGHGTGASLLHRQARLGAIESLNLPLLVSPLSGVKRTSP